MDKATFCNRLTDIDKALDSNDLWIWDNLEVKKKQNGFLRFLKVMVLPFARMFGTDPFKHVRIHNVAMAFLSEYNRHYDDLNSSERIAAVKILQNMQKRAKNQTAKFYLTTILQSIQKSSGASLPPPLPTPLPKPKQTPSRSTTPPPAPPPPEPSTPPPAPPPPPPEEGYPLSLAGLPRPKAATSVPKVATEDPLKKEIEEDRTLSIDDIDRLIYSLNEPTRTVQVLGREKKITDEWIDSLIDTEATDKKVQLTDSDIKEDFRVLYDEFKKLSSETEKEQWLKGKIAYYERYQELFTKVYNHKSGKRDVPKSGPSCTAAAAAAPGLTPDARRKEGERLLKQIELDEGLYPMKSAPRGSLKADLQTKGYTTVNAFLRDRKEVIKWCHKGNLSDVEKKAKHTKIAEIIRTWKMPLKGESLKKYREIEMDRGVLVFGETINKWRNHLKTNGYESPQAFWDDRKELIEWCRGRDHTDPAKKASHAKIAKIISDWEALQSP